MLKIKDEFPSGCNVHKYTKKPIPIDAAQIFAPFKVDTMEGILEGKAGDYLIQGIRGEFYPCDKEIFEESYKDYKGE